MAICFYQKSKLYYQISGQHILKKQKINIWDLENTKFVDMSLMGVGTNILGYSNSIVDNAVKKVIRERYNEQSKLL